MSSTRQSQGDEVSVAISREIYEALRAYCDANNLRLKYFIEEILEHGPRQEELQMLSTEAASLLKKVRYVMDKMDDDRRRAFERGFAQGVLAAYLNTAGYAGLSRETLPETLRRHLQRQPPTDKRQMSLFD